ncbi:putative barnase/colicin E5 family endoribonuclease [Campylobacter lanienae]|uniref:putative barnase/colicin E5 family endoribonuclease n=1 Tax=Campylobacter lanienae TaxID=75658 RepID=UPI0021C15E1C|nr:DUF3519 domain-containing protein [Campylobacter lanienae]
MICPNNFAKEVARASGRKMPVVSDELMKNGFDSVKKGDEIKRINTQKFSSNKVENDNLNSLHNSSDEILEMAAKAGEYEKVFKKEARGIHNVTFNDKKATYIKTDLKNVDSAIRYANSSRDKGAKHIKIRHLTDKTKLGYITNEELVNLGNSLREYIKINKEPFIDSNGARIYEWENREGVRFRAVVDSSRRDETTSELPQPTATDDIITFYSDRNLNEPMNFKNPKLKQADIRGGKAPTTAVGSKSGLALHERIITFYSDRNLNEPIKEFGTNYAEFYHDGKGAIDKLLTERQGQVAGAFEREELGDIDLVWGEFKVVKGEIKGYGLSKIEAKHLDDFAIFEGSTPQEKMANGINEIIQKGVLESKNGVDTIIYKKDNSEFRVGLSKGWNNQGDNRWIITAYNNKKVSSESIETSYHDTFTAKEPLANQRPNSTTTANKSQENILKGVYGKEYPNTIAGRWEKRVDEAFDWAYKNIYAKGVKSGIKGAGIVGRVFGSQESGAKIQRGLEKAFALQDEIGALSRLKSAYYRNNQVARVEAMKVYESLVKLKIDERVALFRMLDGQEVEPNLAGKLRPTYQKLRDKIDERAEQLISLGMLKGENAKENYIKYSYSQYYGKNGVYSKGFGIGKLKARDENLSYEDRVKLGLIEDAAIAVTQTLNSQNSQIQKAILFKSLADEYAVDQPKDGYVKVSDESVGGGVKKYGALAGKYVPSAVYDDLQNAGLVSSIFDVIRPYTNVIDHIKVNLTVKNPATHGYNVLSNSVLAFLHGDLGANLKLMKLLASDKKGFDELLAKAEAMGLDTASDDIEMRNLLMANDEIAKEAIKSQNPLGYYIGKAWQNIYLTKNSTTGRVARSAYAWEDKWFKLARFKKNLDMGMSDEAAFSDANSAYVDYSSHFNPALKVLDKTGVLPFFHFAVKSSIVVTKAAIKNPAKFAMLQTALIGTGASSLPYWFDSEQKDADNSRLPDWASSNYLPNLFGVKNQVQIGESGLYFNAARAMAGFRLSSIDDITGGGGLIGGLLDILRGRDSWGNDMVSKHDPAIKQLTARLDAFSKQFLPSITLGRYGRQGLAIATGNNPKNAYDEPMGLGELAGRFMGLRMINEKKELRSAAINAKNRYKKAKEKGDDGAMVVALNDFMACKAAASDMGVSLEALMKMRSRDVK